MTAVLKRRGAALLIAGAALFGALPASAEAVWHCSRAPQVVNETEAALEMDDGFGLASGGAHALAISLSLMDLIDVYSGKTILINGQRLAACFMPPDAPLSAKALRSMGLNAATMQLQARKSAIVHSHLHLVTDEPEMLACIARRYPAVGYLGAPTTTDQVVPCF